MPIEDAKILEDDAKVKMGKTMEAVRHELSALRAGKATPSLLDNVRVDAYGSQSPLNQVASVTAPEPRMLVVQVWDKALVGEVAKGIQRDELGLNPQVDGATIRIPVPAPTEERRVELVKQAKKYTEEGKVSVRNVRRDVNEHLKKLEKEKKLQEDMFHDALSEVQTMTDKFCLDLDTMYHSKEKEIMEV